MSVLGEALRELRAAIAAEGEGSGPPDLDAVAARSGIPGPEVSRGPDGRIELAVVALERAVPLATLERDFGAASPLPRRPAGGSRTVQFPATLPGDGQRGVTVLAETDEHGRAVRVLLRPDSF